MPYLCCMDVLTPEQRRRNMQAIRSKETKAEVVLAKELWSRGHRYRKNDSNVFGCPDLTFAKYKLAIFVDGEYFHGYNWDIEKHRIKTNQDFWWKKIEGNMKRDEVVNEMLVNNGWTVLRFWTKDLKRNIGNCILKIEEEIERLCR